MIEMYVLGHVWISKKKLFCDKNEITKKPLQCKNNKM